ncbi:hypothetical protein CEXT_233251 [Caerostris extrusa]|uniref:Sodium/hydrogen exchanger 8 n=1 Tax=Caerostris extrusa TaxID=172846 RepID=A0AAV4XXI8_CAEEX|nr:hypothetical protein CEXT_233251 [Caerostris extrusa]
MVGGFRSWGNFFRNIGSILVFAIFGTAVSAFIVGGSLFLLGKKQWVYELTFTESFAFGSFLSAVDPMATLAVFHALEVDPVLNMLVIGESILNDAVAIVLFQGNQMFLFKYCHRKQNLSSGNLNGLFYSQSLCRP